MVSEQAGRNRQMLVAAALLLCTSPLCSVAQTDFDPQNCTETKIAAPPEDGRSMPLGVTPATEEEVWFSLRCGPGAPWFSGPLFVRNVSSASLTPFLPDPERATGAAMIIAPGGGTVLLSMDREGYAVARWLNEHGVAAFVLKYRTVPTPLETLPFLDVLDGITPPYGDGPPVISREQAMAEERATMADGVAAVAYVRERAADFTIDANRIGMIGFSAGAYTTLNVALSADPAGRPDFIGVLYGSLPGGARASASAPPAFIAAAVDDPQVPIAEDVRTFMAWSQAGAQAELHLFRSGSHGFGARDQGTGSDKWRDLFIGWLGEQRLLTK